MQPNRGDIVVEIVPEARAHERVRVSQYLVIVEHDRAFPDEKSAVRHALALATACKRKAYLRTPRGWTDLRPN